MADTFTLDVSRFVEKAKIAPAKVLRKVGLELTRSIVLKTPVGNPSLWQSPAPAGYVGGRARANWAASIGAPASGTTESTDKSGAGTIAAAGATFAAADGTQPLYLINNLPYIRALEYEGHSRQAPAGMVRVTVAEFQTLVDRAAQGVR